MFNNLTAIRQRLQEQIDAEKAERARSEDQMITLLEQTCAKLNQIKYEIWATVD